jgi:hypothetical protein
MPALTWRPPPVTQIQSRVRRFGAAAAGSGSVQAHRLLHWHSAAPLPQPEWASAVGGSSDSGRAAPPGSGGPAAAAVPVGSTVTVTVTVENLSGPGSEWHVKLEMKVHLHVQNKFNS